MDLAASADALHEPANRIYEYYFLMQLFRRLRRKARLFPGKFDASRLRGITSLRLFDDRITAYYCGFTGADDYYARAAAANVVDRIAVPALILHAANDPFIRMQPETLRRVAANPNITYVETADGGHCAFLGEPNGDRNSNGRRRPLGRARGRGVCPEICVREVCARADFNLPPQEPGAATASTPRRALLSSCERRPAPASPA